MDADDRSPAPADAARPAMSGTDDMSPPRPHPRRWPAPAQRADQAVDHRGLSRARAGELAAGADGGRDRPSRRLLRALRVRALPRHPHLADRGDRLRPGPGRLARWRRRAIATAIARRASGPRSRHAARAVSAGCRLWRVAGRQPGRSRPSSSSGSCCRVDACHCPAGVDVRAGTVDAARNRASPMS